MLAPGKYSFIRCSNYDKMMVDQIRKSLNIPQHVHDDMINRQLKYCKDCHMSITDAKNYVNQIYADDIAGRVSEEVKAANAKVMEGYRRG